MLERMDIQDVLHSARNPGYEWPRDLYTRYITSIEREMERVPKDSARGKAFSELVRVRPTLLIQHGLETTLLACSSCCVELLLGWRLQVDCDVLIPARACLTSFEDTCTATHIRTVDTSLLIVKYPIPGIRYAIGKHMVGHEEACMDTHACTHKSMHTYACQVHAH